MKSEMNLLVADLNTFTDTLLNNCEVNSNNSEHSDSAVTMITMSF